MPSLGGGTAYKGGIKGYWKRRGYDRLDAARLRDAYVNAMLRLASSAAVAGYGAAAPYCTAADPFARPRPLVSEYEQKALVEIYRSILARGEAGPGPVVAAGRLPAVV